MHLLIGYTLFLTFRGLLGLESNYRPRSKEDWGRGLSPEENLHCLAITTASGEVITVSSGNAELILSDKVERHLHGGCGGCFHWEWGGLFHGQRRLTRI